MARWTARVDKQALQDGRDYEEAFVKRVGGELQPGSGNKWFARMDGKDAVMLWSVKHTARRSMPIADHIREVVGAVLGLGGYGDMIPGLAGSANGVEFIALPTEDFFALSETKTMWIPQTKGDAKRERAKVPELFRD